MNLKHFLMIGFLTFFSILSISIKSQWIADLRLTNDPAGSVTSNNNAKCIFAYNDNLHVVWYDSRDGNYEIYYKRSTNKGLSWSADTRLTNNPQTSIYPSISVVGLNVQLVWCDNRDGNYEIYNKNSTNGGESWGSDVRFTNNSALSFYPSISISGQLIHVSWEEWRDPNPPYPTQPEIYYKRSSDNGVNWGADIRLTNNPSGSYQPSISSSGQYVHITWEDTRDNNNEIYYKRSIDGGVTWESDVRLTANSGIFVHPSSTVNGEFVHIAWYDFLSGKIYYKHSNINGANWGLNKLVSNNTTSGQYANVFSVNSLVHIVWQDKRDGNLEVYYSCSSDGGNTWGTNTRLTNNPDSSCRPFITAEDSLVYVIWFDNRDGNREIYFKKNPTGNIIGLKIHNTELPQTFSLSQNYPNPFNPVTRIKFSLPAPSKGGAWNVRLVIYDILGREVATLIPPLGGGQEGLKPGSYEVNWEGSKYTSGVYFYRLITDEYVETKKMVLIK